jgi:hypothetical protein
MRCNNCGWDNPPDYENCEKCNVSIRTVSVTGSLQSEEPFELETVKGDQYVERIKNVADSAETPIKIIRDEQPCPFCGYPVMRAMQRCPECGNSINRSEPSGAEPARNIPFAGKTIDPYVLATEKKCRLQPVLRENELSLPPIELQGTNILLKRSLLDATNVTISDSKQAVLYFENGKWYLQDQSSLRNSFIWINRPFEVQKGDVLLFGNRKFEFDCDL